jgi:hypothetical protein
MTIELKERLIELEPGGKRVRLQFDSAVVSAANVEWFGGVMQKMTSSGSRFGSGQTLELGWSIVRLDAAADGALEFREPDFRSMPAKWLPGLSASLVHMALQREVVESVLPAEELAIPGMRQSCSNRSRGRCCRGCRRSHTLARIRRGRGTLQCCSWSSSAFATTT